MTKEYLIILTTLSGQGVAEIHVNSLQQLRDQMPATVLAYDIEHEGNSPRSTIIDAELHDLLIGVVSDIDNQNSHPG
jgi:hypothetical protein